MDSSGGQTNRPVRTEAEQAIINERMFKCRLQRALKRKQREAVVDAAISALASANQDTSPSFIEVQQKSLPDERPNLVDSEPSVPVSDTDTNQQGYSSSLKMDLPPMDHVDYGSASTDNPESERSVSRRHEPDSVSSGGVKTDQNVDRQTKDRSHQMDQNLGVQLQSVAGRAKNTNRHSSVPESSDSVSSDESSDESDSEHNEESDEPDSGSSDALDGLAFLEFLLNGAGVALASWLIYKQWFCKKSDGEGEKEEEVKPPTEEEKKPSSTTIIKKRVADDPIPKPDLPDSDDEDWAVVPSAEEETSTIVNHVDRWSSAKRYSPVILNSSSADQSAPYSSEAHGRYSTD